VAEKKMQGQDRKEEDRGSKRKEQTLRNQGVTDKVEESSSNTIKSTA